MFQCSHCGHSTFEAEATDHTRVLLTGYADGDFSETPVERVSFTWDALRCIQCGQTTSVADAWEAFEQGPRPGVPLPLAPRTGAASALSQALEAARARYQASPYYHGVLERRAARHAARAILKAKAEALRAAGGKYREIADALGVPISTLHRIMHPLD